MSKLQEIIQEMMAYDEKYNNDFWEGFSKKSKVKNGEREYNKKGKLLFQRSITRLKEITPYDDREKLKRKYRVTNVLYEDDEMEYMKYLIMIKKHIVNEDWYQAIQWFIKLYERFDIMQKKIYYSIILLVE